MLHKFYKQVILAFPFSSPKARSFQNLLGNLPYAMVEHQIQPPGSWQQLLSDKMKSTVLKNLFWYKNLNGEVMIYTSGIKEPNGHNVF